MLGLDRYRVRAAVHSALQYCAAEHSYGLELRSRYAGCAGRASFCVKAAWKRLHTARCACCALRQARGRAAPRCYAARMALAYGGGYGSRIHTSRRISGFVTHLMVAEIQSEQQGDDRVIPYGYEITASACSRERAKTNQRTKRGANRGARVGKWAGSAKERTNAKCRGQKEGFQSSFPSTARGVYAPRDNILSRRRWRPTKTPRMDPSNDVPHELGAAGRRWRSPRAWYAKPPKTSRMMG
eukprot:6205103-Pleurochrysis_carterae.AAC.1